MVALGTIVFTGGDDIYQIYIDTYFLFNFWMNLWVLFLCRFLLHSKVSKKRIWVAALGASLGEVLVVKSLQRKTQVGRKVQALTFRGSVQGAHLGQG